MRKRAVMFPCQGKTHLNRDPCLLTTLLLGLNLWWSLSNRQPANTSSLKWALTQQSHVFQGVERECFCNLCTVTCICYPFWELAKEAYEFICRSNTNNHSWYVMSPIRRRERRANTWRGENEHMASIGFSLLHHQICRILIRTLSFFFSLLLFSIMSASSDVHC